MKKILIAVPTNKYIEPETMKSIYDLVIPHGYTTEFQFFYGYQIDQIRNLIAEWGKNYDYLFSVDSDIVLPKDSLIKMIAADVDIISGLYIQRTDTPTLELYKHTGENIHIDELMGIPDIFEVSACGMGCCLIKGELFRKMPYPHFKYRSAINHAETLSEDVYFCLSAAQHGYKTWADKTIICDHIGSRVFKVPPQRSHIDHLNNQDLLPADHALYLDVMSKSGIKPKVVYDIGACVLHWTRKAKEVWPDAKYYVLDGAESVAKVLENSGMSYYSGILSDKDDKAVTFYENAQHPGGNSYYRESTGNFTEEHAKERKTYTLDSVVKDFGWDLPDLIKLDVQGAELDILRGAELCLKHASDVILEAQHENYNEGAPQVSEVIDFMGENGFMLVSNFVKGPVDGDYHFARIKPYK
jgi:FkbM family methyltransferase